MSQQELISPGETHDRPQPPGSSRRFWLPLGAAIALAAILIALIPPEKTLGWVIRPVFVHGALVQAGLLAFAAAALLGLACLVWRRPALDAWCLAAQETAVGLWIAYTLSSTITTRLAWGEWIAWDEPRVRASIHVLWFCLACLLLVRWMDHPIFTAAANIVAGGAVWFLIKGAGLLRHPFDPIGGSNSFTYQVIFWLLLLSILAAAGLVAHRRYRQHLAEFAARPAAGRAQSAGVHSGG